MEARLEEREKGSSATAAGDDANGELSDDNSRSVSGSSSSSSSGSSSTTSAPPSMSYSLLFGLGCAGVLETGYLTWVKLTGGSALCLVGDSDCSSVLNSPYATLGGLPLPLFGMAAYGLVAVLSGVGQAVQLEEGPEKKRLQDGLVASAAALFSTSAALMFVLATRLEGELCPWCLTSAGLSIGIAAAVASGFDAEQLRTRVAPLAAGVSASVLLTLGAAFSGISATASGGGYAFALPYTMPAVETHSSDAAVQMAKKLKNAGAKMYGAFWCSHCFQQKEYFGQEAMADFPYVECYPEGFFRSEDGKGTVIDKACSDIGIRGFPTWVINGKDYEGEQSLENLEADLAIRS